MTVAATSLGPVEAAAAAPPDRRRLQIMIVEDTRGDAHRTGDMLRRHQPSMRLTTHQRIDDAARALADSGVDCVLLDLDLPDADRLGGLHQILAVLPGVPVVVLSGIDDDRLALDAVSRGAQDCVTKLGLSPASLWRAINRAIERAQVTREVTHRATHDELTGLPNRTLFAARVDQAIAHSRRSGSRFGVMVVGVDDFKSFNDNFGHALGDAVLREIATRLAGALPHGDTACRYAGVEFAAICQVTDDAEAVRIATRIHDAICRAPIVVGVRSLSIGVSIGAALGSGDEDAATLMHRVDGAMYEARLTGAVCVVD